MKLAKFTLFLYHNANCVVTIALHAAIPSVVFNTPVCVIDTDDYERSTRFDGLENLFNCVKTKYFVSDELSYDINDPPNNPSCYINLRDSLVDRCQKFTEYDQGKSVFEHDYNPIFDIAQIMPYNENNNANAMMYLQRMNVIKAFVNRMVLWKERYDFI